MSDTNSRILSEVHEVNPKAVHKAMNNLSNDETKLWHVCPYCGKGFRE